jgi:hypothetical protein
MNILAIIAASVAAFISAFLWSGPLFGRVRMRLANENGVGNNPPAPKVSQIFLNYVVFLVTAAVMAGIFALAFSSQIMGERTWYRGVVVAVWLWLGFIVTSSSIEVIWNGRSWKLWLFECASSLLAFALMGAVLGAW